MAPMREIPLYRKYVVVGVALVDDTDYAALARYRWRLRDDGYAGRGTYVGGRDGKRVTILMHRQVLGLAHGDPREGDHRNRNRVDNRRSNLRIVTRAQGAQNRSAYERKKSPRLRGVSFHRQSGKWYARCTVDGVRHSLGLHVSPELAAAAAAQFRAAHMPFAEN